MAGEQASVHIRMDFREVQIDVAPWVRLDASALTIFLAPNSASTVICVVTLAEGE